MPAKGKSKYHVTNAQLLPEIHKSKLSFCEIIDNECKDFDIIVENKKDIFCEENINLAKKNRAKRLNVDEKYIKFYELVFRVMTYEHIPIRAKTKKTIKTDADKHVFLNFKPFKHYVIEDMSTRRIREVVRSHSKNSKFSKSHGKTTEKLAIMYKSIIDEYAKKPNWSGYSYVDEMKDSAMLQLIEMGLKFDEANSNNPFAYITTTIYRSFLNVLTSEKEVSKVKETILQSLGYDQTFNSQAQADIDRFNEKEDNDDYLNE